MKGEIKYRYMEVIESKRYDSMKHKIEYMGEIEPKKLIWVRSKPNEFI